MLDKRAKAYLNNCKASFNSKLSSLSAGSDSPTDQSGDVVEFRKLGQALQSRTLCSRVTRESSFLIDCSDMSEGQSEKPLRAC